VKLSARRTACRGGGRARSSWSSPAAAPAPPPPRLRDFFDMIAADAAAERVRIRRFRSARSLASSASPCSASLDSGW
jgi:hypothetical protein